VIIVFLKSDERTALTAATQCEYLNESSLTTGRCPFNSVKPADPYINDGFFMANFKMLKKRRYFEAKMNKLNVKSSNKYSLYGFKTSLHRVKPSVTG
jgi:hypothetical protein